MKRFFAILLVLVMVFALAACGGKTTEPAPTPDSGAAAATSAPTEAPAPAETPDTEPVPTEEPAPAGEAMETEFWSAVIPEGLTLDEDYSYSYTGYSYHVFNRMDEAGETVLTFSITVENEETMEYRKTLMNYGYSLDAQAAGEPTTVSIGGVDFVDYAGTYWFEDSMTYVGRPAGSGKTVTILIYGADINDADAVELLESLQFTVPDEGFTEAPYPADGEKYIAETGSVKLDGCSLTAQQLVADDSFLVNTSFDNRIAVVGDLLYALSEKTLRIYTLSDDGLQFRTELTLEEAYESMSVTNDGRVFLSAFLVPMMELKDGEVLRKWDSMNRECAVSPGGSFAVSFFTQQEDLKKHTLNEDGTAAEAPFELSGGPELDMITAAFITEDYVGLNAYAAEDDRLYLFLYDHEGNFVMQLKGRDGDSLGSVTAMVELNDRIIALDGNLRDTLVWTKDGNCYGAADDGDLYGSNYPWMSGLCKAGGKLYVSMVDERSDKSWDEMIFFRVDVD